MNIWRELLNGIPLFAAGLKTTLALFFIAGLFGFILGCILALAKTKYIPKCYWFAWGYIELFRNIPLIVILFFFYYALQFTGFEAGLMALIAWASAFFAEILRAGIESLEPQQIQTAKLLGFSRFQRIIHLILPQCLIRIIPVLASQLMNLAKNTSIVYFVGVLDVTYAFEQLSAEYFLFFQFFFIALAIYGLLCFIILILARLLERKTRLWQNNQATGYQPFSTKAFQWS